MLCTLFYYWNSAVSDNKHELILVALVLHITIHKKYEAILIVLPNIFSLYTTT